MKHPVLLLTACLLLSCIDFDETRTRFCATASGDDLAICHPDWPTIRVTVYTGGTVTSAPTGISCPGHCSIAFPPGIYTLTAQPDTGYDFTGWSGVACQGTEPCTLHLTSSTTAIAMFAPQSLPFTVTVAGSGAVALSASSGTPAQTTCSGVCTPSYLYNTKVELTAAPSPGNYFQGWTGACTGTGRLCSVNITQALSTAATFAPITNNLVFVSSSRVSASLGSVTAYDAVCNRLATAAGINSATGDAFVAWMSVDAQSASTHLGSAARGFILVNGSPFTDTLSALLTQNQVLSPIHLDELGREVGAVSVWTGTTALGAAASSCINWTSNTSAAVSGLSTGGPGAWTAGGLSSCGDTAHIYCFMRTKTAPLQLPAPGSGKRIFLSTRWTPSGGLAGANVRCDMDKPAGLGSVVKALLPSTSPVAPASDLLAPMAVYLRPDGQVVGTGAQITAGTLQNGLWQLGSGAYVNDNPSFGPAWAGVVLPGASTASLTDTCNNWSGGAVSGLVVNTQAQDTWSQLNARPCNSADSSTPRLICVEQ